MKKTYFKILTKDLCDEILTKSTVTNPYRTNRTLDGKYILLSFDESNIPVILFKLGYSPLNEIDVKTELQNPEWDVENPPALIPHVNTDENGHLVISPTFGS